MDRNGYITGAEFSSLLVDNSFYPNDHDISLLIDRFDKNNDGRVTYANFIDELLPR
jgi:Ca2+-binding EF-hand superfamily protein